MLVRRAGSLRERRARCTEVASSSPRCRPSSRAMSLSINAKTLDSSTLNAFASVTAVAGLRALRATSSSEPVGEEFVDDSRDGYTISWHTAGVFPSRSDTALIAARTRALASDFVAQPFRRKRQRACQRAFPRAKILGREIVAGDLAQIDVDVLR